MSGRLWSFICPCTQYGQFSRCSKESSVCLRRNVTLRTHKAAWPTVISSRLSRDDKERGEWNVDDTNEKGVGNMNKVFADDVAIQNGDDADCQIIDVGSTDDDEDSDDALVISDDGEVSDDTVELFDSQSPMVSESLQEYWVRRNAGVELENIPMDDLGTNYDIWATSVPEKKFFELRNLYGRVGVHIAYNFFDFSPGEYPQAVEEMSLEDQALYKASCVRRGTGLPAIALATELQMDPISRGGQINKSRDLEEMERMIQAALLVSAPDRKALFRGVAAFCDGECEIAKQQEVEVDMFYCDMGKVSIAHAGALDRLYEDLAGRLGLNWSKFEDEVAETITKPRKLLGSTHLRERILRDAEVLENSLLKVSSFLNHQVDPILIDECGEELAERLRLTRPTKVLAAEATGLLPSLALARKLRIPIVFARKTRVLSANDVYQVSYRSETKGEQCDLMVSTEYLGKDDRVLICDDFLASGSTVEALARLCRMAGADVVAVGVLIEKMAGGGRNFLAGYKVPVLSLAKVMINEDNTLGLVSETVVEVDAS
eukprot:Plantae.Rhodophyta-Hildenbrandia_rubra.ctg4300.p1 GENE.Plantae.Rhodophyta-Hildenbrandia_rubra.ctg4300~~Plantae.Rhodophyta-Hildenbrandia_rubra.ctg4300.p1  ORF type:complete len:545 (-),score=83.31 Plantae.Rhodophyta-Hildenbrandia_rubra.ctg4300:505-2139(-)